jgi:hypothetical protein
MESRHASDCGQKQNQKENLVRINRGITHLVTTASLTEETIIRALQRNYQELKKYIQCGGLYALTFPIFTIYKLERAIKNIWKPH